MSEMPAQSCIGMILRACNSAVLDHFLTIKLNQGVEVLTSRTPPKAADFAADLKPVRKCKNPPVSAPAEIAFQGSSCTNLRS